MQIGAPVTFRPARHPKGVILQGNFVRLCPLEQAHAKDLYHANTQDANWTYLPYGPFADFDGYENWVQGVVGQDDPVFFAIIDLRTNRAIGVAAYLRIVPETGVIEVGHLNFSPALQGTTQASEAMFLMMQWAFENGYRRYEWKCDALNLPSRRAAQRLGFSYEGIFRQATIYKGRNRDTAWFAVIDREWDDLKTCFETFLAPGNFDPAGMAKQSLSDLTRPFLHKRDLFDGA